MPQTLSFNLVHIIFSTKNRVPLIKDDILPALHAYLAGTARKLDCECFRAGGAADHVHLAMRLAATRTAPKLVSYIKTCSSACMKQQGVRPFAWPPLHGPFSLSPT